MRWIRPVIAAVVVVLAVACSGGTVGTPVAELWDPCSIPSEAIAEAGVDPEVFDSGRIEQEGNEWKYCSYRQDWFVLTVSATSNSFEEVLANPRAVQSRLGQIGDRNAVTYEELRGTSDEACFVAYPNGSGTIEFAVRNAGDLPQAGNLCSEVSRLATALENTTPN